MIISKLTIFALIISMNLVSSCGDGGEGRQKTAGDGYKGATDGSDKGDGGDGGDGNGGNDGGENTVPEAVIVETGSMDSWELTMLTRHNAYRTDVGIDNLGWNETLATKAQEMIDTMAADNCSKENGTEHTYGENISYYVTSIINTAQYVDEFWAKNPRGYFDIETKTCEDGQDCSPYTQIIWRNTKTLGCGRTISCPGNPPNDLYLCLYYPKGNVPDELPY